MADVVALAQQMISFDSRSALSNVPLLQPMQDRLVPLRSDFDWLAGFANESAVPGAVDFNGRHFGANLSPWSWRSQA